jgi:hypothetical protein
MGCDGKKWKIFRDSTVNADKVLKELSGESWELSDVSYKLFILFFKQFLISIKFFFCT